MVVINLSVRLRVAKNRDAKLDSGLKLSGTLSALKQGYLNRNSSAVVMNSENYEKLNAFVASTIAQHVPQKLGSSRKNVPWITPKL